MKAEIVKLGTLYSDDRPVKPGAVYYGETLFFEDTEEGNEIEWVKDGEVLIANRCVGRPLSPKNCLLFLFGKNSVSPWQRGSSCRGAYRPFSQKKRPFFRGSSAKAAARTVAAAARGLSPTGCPSL